MRSRLLLLGGAALLSLLPSVHAELHPRLGGAAAYDDVLQVTWLTDAALSGARGWTGQLAWVESLNDASHLGINDWRLASMSRAAGLPTGATATTFDCSAVVEYLCRDNELGYMFYYNLGGAFNTDLSGDHAIGDVTIENVQPVYWSGTEFATWTAWILHFDSGFAVWSPKNGNRFAWAVRDGDVIADPDGDGIDASADNCLSVANPDQHDSNGDGIGNFCDADLQNDCTVNFADLALLKQVFFSAAADADFNNDGNVNFADLSIMKAQFFGPPGPSGVANDCSE